MVVRSIRVCGWLAAGLLLGAQTASALEPDELSPTDLQSKHPYFAVKAPPVKTFGSAADGTNTSGSGFGGALPGLDSVANFTGQYFANGLDLNGNPQTAWYYAMVGNSPELGGTTVIDAPIIPVTVELLDEEGEVRHVNGARLVQSGYTHLNEVLASPVFQNFTYSSSATPTQYNDAIHRAQFWGVLEEAEGGNWHTLLKPSVKKGRVIKIPYGKYQFALTPDGKCCAYILLDDPTFSNLLFPPTYPVDNTTVLGAAELAGEATTKTIVTLLLSEVYLYENGDPKQCCVLGYHTFDFEPGATASDLPRAYVMNYSSWVNPGRFKDPNVLDVLPLSHELAEIFADPFVGFDLIHNITPWWLSPDGGQCQPLMEVGDVLEGLPDPAYPITLNGVTYHPQTVALLPWFEFKKHSHAIGGAYSYPGTDLLTALSPPQKVGCQ